MVLILLLNVFLIFTCVGGERQLKCYHCSHVVHTYECLRTDTCFADTESCFLQSNIHGENISYTQGCTSKQLCGDSNVPSIIGRSLPRKERASEISCCDKDLCNIHDTEVYGLVFKITTYIGDIDVQEAWKTGKGAVSDEYCRNVHPYGCSHHYRHPAIDNWQGINKDLIKYALYKNEVEVASVWFNGTGSSLTDWFSDARIINSTWVDLKPGSTYITQIEREGTYRVVQGRQFILLKSYHGCPDDYGWSVIISEKIPTCVYDNYNLKSPYILYSRLNTYGHYPTARTYTNLGDFDLADAAAVYIYSNK